MDIEIGFNSFGDVAQIRFIEADLIGWPEVIKDGAPGALISGAAPMAVPTAN
jgi:hypothetical protein